MSDKKFLPALLLAIFLGCFGAHRFYVGKAGTGILQLLTCGGVGVWALVDIIMIATGSFRDKEGRPLSKE
jgi:TM2 domain-containing membrane protein YozV